MTTIDPPAAHRFTVAPGVYAPQDDSHLLCDAVSDLDAVVGARVLDLCTGSGIVAVHAALAGARSVTAYDINPDAVTCAAGNAEAVGAAVDVRLGSFDDAAAAGPFDVVVSNPPYVPSPQTPVGMGVHRAWDADADGRLVLDALCDHARTLLAPDGVMLVVHSEFSGPSTTLARLRENGLAAEIVDTRVVPFGPVMHDRAAWLEERGILEPGRRHEELLVIRAERSV